MLIGTYNQPGKEWVRVHEVSLTFNHSASTASETISAIEKQGLVEKIESQKDKRAKPLKLTPEGRQLYEKLVPLLERSFTGFLLDE